MVTFRNNNGRRNNFRRSDRNFKSNVERNKYSNNFSNTENFQRKVPGRNNHNAPKLIEKYNNFKINKKFFPNLFIINKNLLFMLNINNLRSLGYKKVFFNENFIILKLG